MELHEDAYRLREVLTNISYEEIVSFLRKKIPFSDSEIRCRIALQYFLNIENEAYRKSNDYRDEIRADYLCIKHILKGVPDVEIYNMLKILGPIPNRRHVAVKLLLHESNSNYRKRKTQINQPEETDEASSSKLVKVADSTESVETVMNGRDYPVIPKIVLTRDKNANEFMVSSLVPSRPNPVIVRASTNDSNSNVIDMLLNNDFQNEASEQCVSSQSTSSIKPIILPPRLVKLNNQKSDTNERRDESNMQETREETVPKSQNTSRSKPIILPPKLCIASHARNQNSVFDIMNGDQHKEIGEECESTQTAAPSNLLTFPVKLDTSVITTNQNSIFGDLAVNNANRNKISEDNVSSQTIDPPKPLSLQAFLDEFDTARGLYNSIRDIGNQNEVTSTLLDLDAPGPSHAQTKAPGISPQEEEALLRDLVDEETSETLPEQYDSDDTLIDLSPSTKPEAAVGAFNVIPPPTEIPMLPVDEKLVLKLIEMFPNAAPEYIRQICAGKVWSEATFANVVDVILSNDDYPKRPERPPSPEKEVDPEEQLRMLKALLPDADPTFLQLKIEQLAGDQEGLRSFIEDAVDNKNYPTMKDYLRQQQLSAQQKQYTTEFKVERFVELFPDPVSVFEDPKRKTTVLDHLDKFYVRWFMRNKYNQLYVKDINTVIDTYSGVNVITMINALDKCVSKGCVRKTKGNPTAKPDSQNIPLLQELAYFEHKEEILKHLKAKKKQAEDERRNAKELGLLQTCSCCFDDEVMPFDILTCTGGCRFCRVCIKRSSEVAFGEGKVDFRCFSGECNAEFSLQVLQSVLPPKLFSKLAQKKAVAEVKAAGVEDLEMCPFCDFANIPAPEDKLFRCLNPDCMKESCRLCKEPSHVPLRCEEVEKDEDVKARTYIENKMTEALVRECWKCGAKFIKEEGCNKMTCSCGAMMCYICRQPVKDYKHFNGQGGDRHDLCPLYTDNFTVNEKNVLKAAEEAKKEVDPAQLKNDPTADLQKHFGHNMKNAAKRGKHHPGPFVNMAMDPRINDAMLVQMRRFVDELPRARHRNRNDGLRRAQVVIHARQPVPIRLPAEQLLNQRFQAPAPNPNFQMLGDANAEDYIMER